MNTDDNPILFYRGAIYGCLGSAVIWAFVAIVAILIRAWLVGS